MARTGCWLLAVCLGYGVCASPGLGSDGGNVGLDMWPPGGGHHPCSTCGQNVPPIFITCSPPFKLLLYFFMFSSSV